MPPAMLEEGQLTQTQEAVTSSQCNHIFHTPKETLHQRSLLKNSNTLDNKRAELTALLEKKCSM